MAAAVPDYFRISGCCLQFDAAACRVVGLVDADIAGDPTS
jgi:hypothetical protein